jgi:hypothetical protein
VLFGGGIISAGQLTTSAWRYVAYFFGVATLLAGFGRAAQR